MKTVLVANIFSLIGQCFSVYASTRKEKNEILLHQSIFWAIISVSSFLLKGYSAIVTNVMGITRNVLSIRGINNLYLNYALIFLCILFGYIFNSNGLLGYLPIIANVAQSLVVLNEKAKTRHVQIVNCLASLLWTFFNLKIRSYVGCVFNLIAVASYLINIFSAKKQTE